jgi:cell filamentation protein
VPGYTLADGDTVKNKLGATSHEQLEEFEADPVRRRIFEIESGLGPSGQFDSTHLKALHHYIFQDVFEWAGHTRDEQVRLSDGSIATEPIMRKAVGKPFLSGPLIPSALDGIATKIREAGYLRDLPRNDFSERAADIMSELNAIHPFREGNGRTQRVFFEQLAQAAGHDLDFTVISKERMIRASIAAHEENDPSMMRRMFDEISNPERTALLREGIEKLQAAFDRNSERTGEEPAHWNDLYLATVTRGHNAELVLAGVAGGQFMARTKNEILIGKASDLPEPRPERGQTFTLAHLSQGQKRQRGAKDEGAGEPARVPSLEEDLRNAEARAAESRDPNEDANKRGRPRGGGRGR